MAIPNLSEQAKEGIAINQFILAFTMEPGRALSGAITRALENAWREDLDGLDLMYEALRKIKEPTKVDFQKLTPRAQETSTNTAACLVCELCGKQFEKGLKGWAGGKRFCKKDCTVDNLKAA